MNSQTPLPLLIQSLLNPACYDHEVIQIQLIQTHISWVILTGEIAYKIKKPVNLGFLDFSTLDKRRFYCEEEVRLNRRLAAEIYLDVIEIKGTAEHPQINGKGDIIEYAVKMLQFSQDVQLDRVLERGDLKFDKIDSIAHMLAIFHEQIEVADSLSPYGEPELVIQPFLENFSQIREQSREDQYTGTLATIENWYTSAKTALSPLFKQRKVSGFIRECHGDLHLRNIAWHHGKPLAFDCLEFNANLRWIDVMSEVAFLVMDLQDHHQELLAQRFLNAYLEHSGDYAGIKVLKYYLTYRAMVRAKVNAIMARQHDISQQQILAANQDCHDYLNLAKSYTESSPPVLIITHGLSASGKTTETQPLLELMGAVRIRSDVERKRLFGLKAQEDASAGEGEGIYSPEATEKTYTKLMDLAEMIIEGGYTVIIDAANLQQDQRQLFRNLASQNQVAFIILDFTASTSTLRRRILERKHDASDANLEVLEHQLDHWQPITDKEKPFAINIDTEQRYDVLELIKTIYSTANRQSESRPVCTC